MGFALGMALGTLAMVEAALRIAYTSDDVHFVWERSRPPLREPRRTQGKAPPQRDGPYEWRVTRDDFGVRAPVPPPLELPPDTVRLLAVGDSWVYGYGIAEGHTLADELGRLLDGRLGSGAVSVLNAGEPGANAGTIARLTLGLLQRYPDISGVIFGQPHNPPKRTRKGAAPAPPVELPYLYLLPRQWIAPLIWRRAPRHLKDADVTLEVSEIARLMEEVRRQGRRAWFLLLPNDVETATTFGFPPDSDWVEGISGPMGGHALPQRSCWGFTDPFHPSEAGVRAMAEVMAEVIAQDRREPAWTTTPTCDDVPGAGPGKAGWEVGSP